MKRAFTLMELLIVIVIIGVVYALVAGDFKGMFRNDTVRVEKLKDFLMSKHKKFDKIRVECEDDGKRCSVYIDSSPDSNQTISLFSVRPTVYQIDTMGQLSAVKYPRDELCFVYELRSNGSSTPMVVEMGSKILILYSYFRDYDVVESIEEAKAKLIQTIE